MRLATLAVVLGAILAGCNTHAEQQHKIRVENASSAPVIVRIGQHRSVRLEPGTGGMGVNSFGLLHGPIVVMDPSCRVLQSVEATPQQYGTLWIREDGRAVLEEGEPGEGAMLDSTEECDVDPS